MAAAHGLRTESDPGVMAAGGGRSSKPEGRTAHSGPLPPSGTSSIICQSLTRAITVAACSLPRIRASDTSRSVWLRHTSVTQVWRSQTDLDVSLARIRGSEQAATVMALVKDWQMIELVPLGGKGPE